MVYGLCWPSEDFLNQLQVYGGADLRESHMFYLETAGLLTRLLLARTADLTHEDDALRIRRLVVGKYADLLILINAGREGGSSRVEDALNEVIDNQSMLDARMGLTPVEAFVASLANTIPQVPQDIARLYAQQKAEQFEDAGLRAELQQQLG